MVFNCTLSAILEIWSLLYKFHHLTNLFLHAVYCSIFCLVAFFMFCSVGLSLFFNAFWHQACLPSLHVSLLPFLNLHCSHNLSLLDIKRLKKFDPCGCLQSVCFVVINTYFVYVKTVTYPKWLYSVIFTANTTVQHSANL